MRSSRHTCESDRSISLLINVFWKFWHAALTISFRANLRPHFSCRITCSTTLPQSHFFISRIVKVLQPLKIFQLGSFFFKFWHAALPISFRANLRPHFWYRIACSTTLPQLHFKRPDRGASTGCFINLCGQAFSASSVSDAYLMHLVVSIFSNLLSSKANIGDFYIVAQYYIPPLSTLSLSALSPTSYRPKPVLAIFIY